MPEQTYRTFAEWNAAGRAVIPGQHAQYYLVDPDTHQGVAVFSRDQTFETSAVEDRSAWELVPAAEYKANRQPKQGPPRVLVGRAPDGEYAFWVGTNAKLNKAFRTTDYVWDRKAWRWVSHAGVKAAWRPEAAIQALADSPDYTLIREFDVLEV